MSADNADAPPAPAKVSVEAVLHQAMREIAEGMAETHGLRITRIDFEWDQDTESTWLVSHMTVETAS